MTALCNSHLLHTPLLSFLSPSHLNPLIHSSFPESPPIHDSSLPDSTLHSLIPLSHNCRLSITSLRQTHSTPSLRCIKTEDSLPRSAPQSSLPHSSLLEPPQHLHHFTRFTPLPPNDSALSTRTTYSLTTLQEPPPPNSTPLTHLSARTATYSPSLWVHARTSPPEPPPLEHHLAVQKDISEAK